MHRIAKTILFALLTLTLPLIAQEFTITPNRGPAGGGTEVTVRGEFGNFPYSLIFGSTSVPATKVNDTTLVATTPAHLPGRVVVTVFEYDRGVSGNELTFTFEGDAQAVYDAVLLPVFVGPIPGAHGSEFRTDFRARLVNETQADLYGLRRFPCTVVLCPEEDDQPLTLTLSSPEVGPEDVEETGTPGAFLYLPKDQTGRVAMNLRAYDTSRSAENFGTEIPVVPASEFVKNYDPITLIGIPSDPRFRNTLRIYGYGSTAATLILRIEGEHGANLEHVVELPPQPDVFHPGYVEFTNFPVNAGRLRVTIDVSVPPISAPIPPPDRWAFLSVTNNETQHITLITPQP